MVNHFEELGLGRSAGVEEIRRAYRRVASLLHPDRQRDNEQARLADLQMKRLHEAVGVLLDPARRAEYEAQLDGRAGHGRAPAVIVVPAAPPEAGARRWMDARSVLLFAAGAAFATLLWHGFDATRGTAGARAATPAPDEPDATALEQQVGAMEHRLQSLEAGQKRRKAAGERPGGGAGLAGVWSYDLEGGGEGGAPLASKRIDLSITDENGVLHGTYRSQGNPLAGQAADEVVLRFEGKPEGGRARLPWSSSDGGNGEIEIRLLGSNTLETRWWSYGGGGGGENHGTAVLRRSPSGTP